MARIYDWVRFVPLVALSLLLFYFFMAALQGENGLFHYLQLKAKIKLAEAEHAQLTSERERLTNLTLRLSNSYLDLDLLEERARDRLGLIRADEMLIR